MKRKKRLEKGIKSIEEQIEFHKEKLKKAIEKGNEELAGYYIKEIESLNTRKEDREDILDKQ